ncbi:MAG: M14 family metallopeptidase [Candidatus Saccharicenans sp.]|uniref:M14 family metallopeptidase n=1 Tax=Candidatus Saccharicenans sp. TaxID=2819258 RepID=UPI00404A7421
MKKKANYKQRLLLLIVSGLLVWLSLTTTNTYWPDRPEVIALERDTDLQTLRLRFPLDPLLDDGQKIYFLVEKKYLEAIKQAGYSFSLETGRFLRPAEPGYKQWLRPQGGLNGAYHSYQELASELKTLAAAHPALARLFVIGRSLENRNIYALKVSDQPGLAEDEPGVAFFGCHHAREWISVEVPLLIGKYLLENYSRDSQVKALVDSAEIWIVPLVNPDGLEYSILNYRLWRKNRRLNLDGSYGVDPNRNYSYGWAYDDLGSSPEPDSSVFRGTAPFSEPETEAIRNLFQTRRIATAISYHSYSQLILYPWGYVDQPTEDELLFQQLAEDMAALIYQVNGRVYQAGRAASLLYVTNGDFTDWAYGFYRIPAFTIELPPVDLLQGGFWNAEEDIQPIFQENLPAALYLINWAISTYDGTRSPRPGPDRFFNWGLEKEVENIVKGRPGAAFKGKESR